MGKRTANWTAEEKKCCAINTRNRKEILVSFRWSLPFSLENEEMGRDRHDRLVHSVSRSTPGHNATKSTQIILLILFAYFFICLFLNFILVTNS